MKVTELYDYLLEQDFSVTAVDGKLRIASSSQLVSEEIRTLVLENKNDLLHLVETEGKEMSRASRIPLVSRDNNLELSFAQQRLWFLSKLEGTSANYNIPMALRLQGKLDKQALISSLRTLVERHEVLRTRFVETEGSAYQLIDDTVDFQVAEQSLADESLLTSLCEEEALIPFDLSSDQLVRARLLGLADGDHVLLITMHHSVSDGWSMGIFFDELVTLYRSYCEGAPSPLVPLEVQYADFSHWQRQWLSGDVMDSLLSYWKEQLTGLPPLLELPTDRPRPSVQTYKGARKGLHFSPALLQGLNTLGQAQGTTLYMTLLAGFSVLLGRYSNQTDIAVGSPIANRNRPELERLIGFFVNTLVMRTDVSGEPVFLDLLAQVKETALAAYAHQDIPFEYLVEALEPERNMSYSPLFQVMFVLQNIPSPDVQFPDLTISPVEIGFDITKFDLTLNLQETDEGLQGSIEYNTDLFDEATIERFIQHYERLLQGIVEDPARRVSEYRLLSDEELQQQLVEWNDTGREYPSEKCIHELIAEQVAKTPDSIAVEHEGETLTYRALDEQSNRIAHYLRSEGVGPETLVGICIDRSIDMVVGLLGILKAGGAYVPIDPAYPEQRISYILEDSGVELVLSHSALAKTIPEGGHKSVYLDTDTDSEGNEGLMVDQTTEGLKPEELGLTASNLAYIIYTSGSTGNPKGVMIEHRNATAMLHWGLDTFSSEELRAAVASSSICFDLSVYEMFLPLCKGGRVIVLNDILDLVQNSNETDISLINTVPSAIHELAMTQNIPDSVITINLAGEALRRGVVNAVANNSKVRSVNNLYGPAEDTTYSTHAAIELDDGSEPSIGRPIANTKAYVLDNTGNPVPIGVVGELYLSGDGVARGYLHNVELTESRFCPDHLSGNGNDRMYRTGDLARYRKDGVIEYIGRNDFQVKIRGFRIELGEIENALLSHSSVRDCVVSVYQKQDGDKSILAYIVREKETETESDKDFREALESYLRETLPAHMVPAMFVMLDSLPLNTNGKVDRKSLPTPSLEFQNKEYEAPENELETLIADIWEGLLELDSGRIGVHDNFFSMGGHSLLIPRMVAELSKNGVIIDVQTVFRSRTLRSLAQEIAQHTSITEKHESKESKTAGEIPPNCIEITDAMLPLVSLTREQIATIVDASPGGISNIKDIYPLGPLQEGMLFHHLLNEADDPYIVLLAYSVENREYLDEYLSALQQVINRHDALRTLIYRGDLPESVQVVLREAQLQVEEFSLESKTPIQDQITSLIDKPHWMSLEQAPLLRIRIAPNPHSGEWIMLIQFHHIVLDHISLDILNGEIAELMAGRGSSLSAPGIYREFISSVLDDRTETDAGQFFDKLLSDQEEPSNAFDLCGSECTGKHYSEFNKKLSVESSEEIRRLASQLSVSPSVLFHVVWAVVVAHSSGNRDAVFGSVMSGRLRAGQFNDTLGLFINTLPFRLRLKGKDIETVIKEANELIGNLIPYEQTPLSTSNKISESTGGGQLFNSLLNFRHSSLSREESGSSLDSHITPLSGRIRTNYPISVAVDDFGDSFGIDAKVDGRISAERIVSCIDQTLQEVIKALKTDHSVTVNDISIVPEEDLRKVLYEWNDNSRDFGSCQYLHEFFESQVAKTPGNLAIENGAEKLSYEELNKRANQLAHYLIDSGVDSGSIVGLLAERSIEMMVALLAILKSGAAYVPIDPKTPASRIQAVLESCSAKVLVTHRRTSDAASSLNLKVLDLDTDSELISRCSDVNPVYESVGLTSDSLAYLIYTSGSTGQPKGVMIPHRSVVNFLYTIEESFTTDELVGSVVSSSVAFDATVQSLYLPFCSGRSVKLLPDDDSLIETLASVIFESDEASLFKITPSHLKAVLGLNHVKRESDTSHVMVVAGEEFDSNLLKSVNQLLPNARIHNEYGPTEATVGSSAYLVPDDFFRNSDSMKVPIGSPFPNVDYYVLDEQRNPKAIMCQGELYIGGAGLALGYLGQPDLTATSFVDNPFSSEKNSRIYKTGDHVRWLEDGNIEYVGRIDNQVKIRGNRVELNEIEVALSEIEEIQKSVVIIRDHDQLESSIFAYVVLGESVSADSENNLQKNWREYLKSRLPAYMVPAAFIVLEELPMTISGKIDRKSLPIPVDEDFVSVEYIHPVTPTEKALADIWSDIFDTEADNISNLENFFDLGGHSLLAVSLVSEIRTRLETEISISEVFDNPILSDLASTIDTAQSSSIRTAIVPSGNGSGKYRASYAQKRLWFVDKLNGGNSAHYNMPGAVKVYGEFDEDIAEIALQRIVDRHEALRTVFEGDDEVWQVVKDDVKFNLQRLDFSDLSKSEQDSKVRSVVENDANTPFNLASDLMLRGVFIRLDEQESVLLFNTHHIASDGTSLAIFMSEFHQQYEAIAVGGENPFPPLEIQYADYSNWQNSWMKGDVLNEQADYWKEQLKDLPPVHGLPMDFQRPAIQTYEGRNYRFKLKRKVLKKLKSLAKSRNSSLFMVLHAALSLLHARIGTSKDIAIGTPMANRLQKELEPIIGFFLNTIVLRTDCSQNIPFVNFLDHVKDVNLQAQTYQDIPFEYLVEYLNPDRSTQYTPLFQIMLHLNNTPVVTAAEKTYSEKYHGEYLNSEEALSKFEMTLHAWEVEDELQFIYEYKTSLFLEDTVIRMSEGLLAILEGIAENSDCPIMELPIMNSGDTSRILDSWTETSAEYPKNRGMHELFIKQSALTPNNIAVRDADGHLSYKELKDAASHIAVELLNCGVSPDELVGVVVNKSCAQVAAVMGVLFSGAAYLPVDVSWPMDRQKTVLTAGKCRVVLSVGAVSSGADWPEDIKVINVDDLPVPDSSELESFVPPAVSMTDLAYVIFTSGSTGIPKGVMIEHGSVVNTLHDINARFQVTAQDSVLALSSLSFDLSVYDLFGLLAVGGCVVMPQEEDKVNPEAWVSQIREHDITLWNTVPGVFQLLVDYLELDCAGTAESILPSLRLSLLSGDWLPVELPRRSEALMPELAIVSLGGATEASIWSNCYPVEDVTVERRSIPYGKPLGNQWFYILDELMQPCPIGVEGYLYIGGVGLARGYWDDPEQTANSFIDHEGFGERIYKTGDLGRWLADGNIEFLGRRDGQVKIRGFRIELGEVESQLKKHGLVNSCVAIVREDEPGDRRLVAYITTAGQESDSIDEAELNELLRAHLQETLPDYMVPSAIVALAQIPLTANGKVDRKSLPVPSGEVYTQEEYVAPQSEAEQVLVTLWAELLNLKPETISVTANFFELGGHSLLVVHLLAAIRKEFGVELPLKALYESLTVEYIAKILEENESEVEEDSILAFIQNSSSEEQLEEFEF